MKARRAGIWVASLAIFAFVEALDASTSARRVTSDWSSLVICAGVNELPMSGTGVALVRCFSVPAINCFAATTT
jgi:hypothetical protein